MIDCKLFHASFSFQEIEFICLVACLLNKNGHYAYNFIREIVVKQLDNNRAWNLFSQIVSLSQDFRHNRFCLRLMLKNPTHLALGLLNGHNALVSGTYKHALGELNIGFDFHLQPKATQMFECKCPSFQILRCLLFVSLYI